ncbi:hypothetical protein AB7459_22175 [Providencia rettgeri]
MQAGINQQRSENKKMKLLTLNDEEYSLLQNILNNFVLHGVESIPNDDSCNVLKMNDKVNELKDIEPVGYIDNAESINLEHDRVCYLYKDSIDKINIPLYRLDK